ncbi:DNA cytosine methyltransferase [Oerskovia jenensis]|uniref:DNA (cytosine-5-)-methyltransferase n=1 Tax=Oerskovia jenensis TaxID=162169 RepID=A0ABS2LJ38_9CELL|nr:DNA cytosine methyltransferase [Oerskovia jenensis]MBM7480154.1 DNA (cytosine-5)-methyltransferase 1 [Oerskovia jenensis]
MSHNLTATDLFCGAGGSSTGMVQIPGVEVRLAANHWDIAIETHNANHPDTDHLQADISNTDPRYIATTDLLWASPECTNHSRAKGRKLAGQQPDLFGDVLPEAAAERSRATMWDVVRFAEAHHYKAVLVENVVEVVDWSSPWGVRGGLFQSWLGAMHALGYRHRIISMNSMHAQAYGLPAPQSRDRVYIAFWRTGDRTPDFEHMLRPKAYCARCDQVVDAMQWWKKGDGQARPGRYRSQYLYRCPNVACRNDVVEPAWLPASSIIDWSNPGTRIGDRAKPLAEKTMRRIQVGIERYWSPIHVEHGGNQYDAADPKHVGFGDPSSYYRAWPASEPLRTMHTRESKAIAYMPVMVPVEGRDGKQPMTVGDALRTQTTRNESGLAFPPFLAELRGGGSTARPAADPLATVTASGNHHGLVMPYYGRGQVSPADRALPTVTTIEKHALIHRNNGGGAEMTTPAREPIRTITTAGHQSLLTGGTVDIEDVRFRMLEPSEIKQAMAFPADYVMAGNRREQVKLSGNAVTPPAARDLVATVVHALTGEGAPS